jgi:hypothetical protein
MSIKNNKKNLINITAEESPSWRFLSRGNDEFPIGFFFVIHNILRWKRSDIRLGNSVDIIRICDFSSRIAIWVSCAFGDWNNGKTHCTAGRSVKGTTDI